MGPIWVGRLGFFLLGAISLLIQTVLIRETMFAFSGGEIGLGLFYAVWVAAIAAGAVVGGLAIGRPANHHPANRFSFWLVLLPLIGIVQIVIFRYQQMILPVAAGGYLSFGSYLILLLVAVSPAGLITGFLFPVGISAWSVLPGRAYAIEAAGSMVGGAVICLYALGRVSVTALLTVAVLVVLVWFAIFRAESILESLRTNVQSAPKSRAAWSAIVVSLLLIFLLIGSLVFGFVDRFDQAWLSARWDLLATGTAPVVSCETPSNHVTISERGGELSLYLDGQFQETIHDPYVDSLTAAVLLTQHRLPRRVVIFAPAITGPVSIIAGMENIDATLVRENVWIDQAIDRALDKYPHPEDSGRNLDIVSLDARIYLASCEQGVDEIIVHYGGPVFGASNRFYTEEFFTSCAEILDYDGVLALTLPGTANVAAPEDEAGRAALFSALQNVFIDVRVTPGESHLLFASGVKAAGDVGADGKATLFRSPLTSNGDSLSSRLGRLWPHKRQWPAAVFSLYFPEERTGQLRESILQRISAGVDPNRDDKPIAFYQQIRRWDRLSGSGLSSFLEEWFNRPLVGSGFLLLVLVGVGAVSLRRWGYPLVCLSGTGLIGMSSSMLLLFSFQTCLGTLYLKIGLLNALFMAGLALGSILATAILKRRPRTGQILNLLVSVDLGWILFLACLIPLLTHARTLPAWGAELMFQILALMAGLLTALPFPWVAFHQQQCLGSGSSDRASSAQAVAGGMADGADHAGAITGALVTGTLLIPLLGFTGTMLFMISVKVISVIIGLRRIGLS